MEVKQYKYCWQLADDYYYEAQKREKSGRDERKEQREGEEQI
jgi:hypothetical protein